MNEVSQAPDPMVFIREAVDDVHAYLAMWANRRPLPEPDAAARAAASAAVERIDATIARLHEIRSTLVGEIRQSDAAWLALDDNPDEG